MKIIFKFNIIMYQDIFLTIDQKSMKSFMEGEKTRTTLFSFSLPWNFLFCRTAFHMELHICELHDMKLQGRLSSYIKETFCDEQFFPQK